MKITKKTIIASVILFATASLFAYNPPNEGENLFGFSNPFLLTNGSSTAGGGIFECSPSSMAVNPAILAFEQRVTFDFGYTGMFSSVDESAPYGQSFNLGALMPTPFAVVGGEIVGVFVPFKEMQLGNSFTLKTAAAKKVADRLSLGVGVNAGITYGYNTDWLLTADIGGLYEVGDFGFMKDIRFGASVLNIGKTYNSTTVKGIYGNQSNTSWKGYPCFMTVKTGAAANFVKTKDFVLGLSFDVSFPFFNNIIFDSGLQIDIKDFFRLSTSWQYDMNAVAQGYAIDIPTVGISFKFNIDTKFIGNNEMKKSEMAVSSAWKNVNGNINAVSLGATVNLGQKDTEAPVIEIMDDEE